MTRILRRAAVVWLVLGTLVFLHGAMTGSGLAGMMLYHQLVTAHDVSPSTVSELLSLPLCVAPLAILIVLARNSPPPPSRPAPQFGKPVNLRRALLLGGLAGGAVALALRRGRSANVRLFALIALGIAGVCFAFAAWDLLQVGEPLDFKPTVNLDTDQAFPPVREATVTGTLQTQLALAYEVTGEAKGVSYGHAVRLVPLTSAAWRPGQPVRVLADAIGGELPADGSRTTQRGFVSPGVPGYVRRAFSDQGVTLDANVIILRTAPDTNIDSILLAIGLIALALGFALAFANRAAGIPPPAR
jgi:hypothetical protein